MSCVRRPNVNKDSRNSLQHFRFSACAHCPPSCLLVSAHQFFSLTPPLLPHTHISVSPFTHSFCLCPSRLSEVKRTITRERDIVIPKGRRKWGRMLACRPAELQAGAPRRQNVRSRVEIPELTPLIQTGVDQKTADLLPPVLPFCLSTSFSFARHSPLSA